MKKRKGGTYIKELRPFFRHLRRLQATVIPEKKRRFPDEESFSGVILITHNSAKTRLVAVGANCRQWVIVITDHLPPDKRQAVNNLVAEYQITAPY